MKTLEKRHFVVRTDADIIELVTKHDDALTARDTARATYLKALVATTQDELGVPVRLRAGRAAELSADDTAVHLTAFEKVQQRFYAAVLKAIGEGPPKERNARANFARSAASTLRRWIKAGNDIRALAAARVTKASLRVGGGAGRGTAPPARRVEQLAGRLTAGAEELAKTDKAAAITAVEAAMTRLATLLISMGGQPTRDPQRAIDEHRLFKTGSAVFWPATAPQ
jgi:hypothetical protein